MKISGDEIEQLIRFPLSIPPLAKYSVRLMADVNGKSVNIGSATILYKEPYPDEGTTNSTTILVTSKGTLALYNLYLGNTQLPPLDPTNTAFKNLKADFLAKVTLCYNEKLLKDPKTDPNSATVKDIHFKAKDSDWTYDLCLLESDDDDLATFASTNGAWGDVSAWVSLGNMPKDINGYYASALESRAFLFGFGTPVIPFESIYCTVYPKYKDSKYTLGYGQGNTYLGTKKPLKKNSLQACSVKISSKTPLDTLIYTWPWPQGTTDDEMPDYAAISYDTNTQPANTYKSAVLLQTDDTHVAVKNDTGGGAFVLVGNSDSKNTPRLIGVISGINGTTEGKTSFDTDFKRLKSDNAIQVIDELKPYLPWPTKNQVVTLLSPMLNNWPLTLAWPKAPTGFFRPDQQPQATSFVSEHAKKASESNPKKVVNKAFNPTLGTGISSYYNSSDIKHESAGAIGSPESATLFYQRVMDGNTILSIQIIGVGAHKTNQTYEVFWVWDTYTEWYDENFTEWGKQIKGQPKNIRQPIDQMYRGMLGLKITAGQVYNLNGKMVEPDTGN